MSGPDEGQKSDENQDINEQDDEGRTRLYLAVRHGHQEEVRLLLAEGANPNICETRDNWSPLFIAIRVTKNINMVRLLLSYGANPLETSHRGHDAKFYARQLSRSHRGFSLQCIQLLGDWIKTSRARKTWKWWAIRKRRTRERNLEKHVLRKKNLDGTDGLVEDHIKDYLNYNNTPLIF